VGDLNLLRRLDSSGGYVMPNCHPLVIFRSSATDPRNRDGERP